MEIKTLASGSTGNAYLVGDGTTTLLLECGISMRELMRRSRFTLSRVDACLITHEHGDHARAVHDVMARGIPVYCSEGTAAKLGYRHYRRASLFHVSRCRRAIGVVTGIRSHR